MNSNETNKLVFKTCMILVQHFKNLVESGNIGFNSRIFQHMLHWEFDFVGIGQSKEVTEESGFHPEHIVPCAVLIEETRRLIKEDVLTIEEIAQLLQKHWKIARITKGQAKEIDFKLGLKSKMPQDWCFETGDTMARLDAASIKILPMPNSNG